MTTKMNDLDTITVACAEGRHGDKTRQSIPLDTFVYGLPCPGIGHDFAGRDVHCSCDCHY